jgi:hypothetical protein
MATSLIHAGNAAHPATLRSLLASIGVHLLQAVKFLVMPLHAGDEDAAPRHMELTLRLLRRADELDSTDPDAAMKLRMMASSYCCV